MRSRSHQEPQLGDPEIRRPLLVLLLANLGTACADSAPSCFGESAGIAVVRLRALSGERKRGQALARPRTPVKQKAVARSAGMPWLHSAIKSCLALACETTA